MSGEEDLGRGGTLQPVLLILELMTVCKLVKKNLKEFKPTTFLDVINNRYAYFIGKEFNLCFSSPFRERNT